VKAAIYGGPRSITVGERPDPRISDPSDAVVRVVLACVCGSDLWYLRGESPHDEGPIGHEFIGVVEEVGSAVRTVNTGDFVVAPFTYSDGSCANCLAGVTSQCVHGGGFGNHGIDGGQGEAVRVPLADGTLIRVPGTGHSDDTMRSLMALSDVMCTGNHAAVSAGVKQGDVVAVVGDGAVGLCAVVAARRLGAERIIMLSRNPPRQALARTFGATDIVDKRGVEADEAVKELTSGIGVDASLECVGTAQSVATAMAIVRPGSMVGVVGAPHGVDIPVVETVVYRNIGIRGGVAPARAYIPELMDDVLEGRINPGLVFDYETDLDHIAAAYAAMDERRAIKSLVRVGSM
jgi:threonine dehydrogenase-like Zn-dependent dehydrogenase